MYSLLPQHVTFTFNTLLTTIFLLCVQDDGRNKDRLRLRGSGLEQEEEESKPKYAGDL